MKPNTKPQTKSNNVAKSKTLTDYEKNYLYVLVTKAARDLQQERETLKDYPAIRTVFDTMLQELKVIKHKLE